ncbi:MAG: TrkA family potassium uptake protein [Dehalococcoidia bacterium]|nr:TrkA family potassium uptake protein [Dehalococcoidia bacterium]MDD5493335.1 TrkA family potassium uptake protein [Dehalococcoidia bacterium]
MKGQIAVLGVGRFGYSLASTLYEMGHDVMAMDINEKRVQAISPHVTHAVEGDATDEAVLRDVGIKDFEIAIVASGSAIEDSVLSTLLLKKLGVRHVIARAINDLHGDILQKIGADQVVFPQRDMGRKVAHGVTLIDVEDYIPLTQRYGVSKLPALPYLVGKRLSEVRFGRKGEHGIAVLLLQRKNEIIINPGEKEIIHHDDTLILAGNDDKLAKLLANAKKKNGS